MIRHHDETHCAQAIIISGMSPKAAKAMVGILTGRVLPVRRSGKGLVFTLRPKKDFTSVHPQELLHASPRQASGVSVLCGRLRPGRHPLLGGGLTDWIRSGIGKAREFISSKFSPRRDYNNRSRKTLEEWGNAPIKAITLIRTPIKSMLNTALNAISLGKWDEVRQRYGYDRLFHLGMLVDLDGGKRVLCEKNEVVNISPSYRQDGDAEIMPIVLKAPTTLKELLDRARTAIGDESYFLYNAFKDNCQAFIRDVLRANGLLTPEAEKWLFQPVDQLVKDLPGFVPQVAKAATDLAATVNHLSGAAAPCCHSCREGKACKGTLEGLADRFVASAVGAALSLSPEEVQRLRAQREAGRTASLPRQRCPPEMAASGRCRENLDGTVTFTALPGDQGYHDESEGYTYRRGVGWTGADEAREAFLAARDRYDQEHGMTGFRTAVNTLRGVADAVADAPFLPKIVSQAYKAFRPRGEGLARRKKIERKR